MRLKSIVTVLLIVSVFTGCANKIGEIKVMTLNIRMDTPEDSMNAWPHRAHIVSSFVKKESPDLFGMQEVLWHQYTYLDSALKDYGSVAVGREDGRHAGEASPVFWLRTRFEAHANGTFWLSATPEVPGSIGWGAACTRIATWVKLTDRSTGDTILFMNTHFDHISDSARVMAAIMLRQRLSILAGKNKFILTGDFNALPDSPAIKNIVSDGGISDTHSITKTPPVNDDTSFNSFSDKPLNERIDYIFVRKGMKAKDWKTMHVKENGIFISDHWPVIATITD